MDTQTKMALAATAAALVGVAILAKKFNDNGGVQGFFQDAASGAVGVAFDAVDGTVSGVGYGIGDRIGVPRTNMNACELAIAEGRTWDASFACPAGRFLEYVTTGK